MNMCYDIIWVILLNLSYEEIMNKRLISKDWKAIIENDNFWCELYKKHFKKNVKGDCYKKYTFEYIHQNIKKKKMFRLDEKFFLDNFDNIQYITYQYVYLSDNIFWKIWRNENERKKSLKIKYRKTVGEHREFLIKNKSLHSKHIAKYWPKWKSTSLSKYASLTLEIIEMYKDYINFEQLSSNTSITPEIIDKYFDLLNIDNLSDNPALTSETIEKYRNKLNSNSLSNLALPLNTKMNLDNPLITPKFIQDHWTEFTDEEKLILLKNPSLTMDLIEEHFSEFNFIGNVLDHHYLSPEIIEKHWNDFNVKELIVSVVLTPRLEKFFLKRFDWIL